MSSPPWATHKKTRLGCTFPFALTIANDETNALYISFTLCSFPGWRRQVKHLRFKSSHTLVSSSHKHCMCVILGWFAMRVPINLVAFFSSYKCIALHDSPKELYEGKPGVIKSTIDARPNSVHKKKPSGKWRRPKGKFVCVYVSKKKGPFQLGMVLPFVAFCFLLAFLQFAFSPPPSSHAPSSAISINVYIYVHILIHLYQCEDTSHAFHPHNKRGSSFCPRCSSFSCIVTCALDRRRSGRVM